MGILGLIYRKRDELGKCERMECGVVHGLNTLKSQFRLNWPNRPVLGSSSLADPQ